MTPTDAPLILLSGMGADERVFAAQLEAFPNLTVPTWIPPVGDESLAQYARRFAARVDPSRPCFVGGASFGGFVALEMARHLPAVACFLIGSVRSPAELPWRVRSLRCLAARAPTVAFSLGVQSVRAGAALFGPLSAPATRAFLRQASDADARFLRWASRAVLTWRTDPDPLRVPIHQIHGDRDHVLPARLTRPDVLVPDAGHVLSMTHAEAVHAFLRDRMARYASALGPAAANLPSAPCG
jgi:pimeloyl-ACP methyl ester carboxylesterase